MALEYGQHLQARGNVHMGMKRVRENDMMEYTSCRYEKALTADTQPVR
jgi:hypothetical protein